MQMYKTTQLHSHGTCSLQLPPIQNQAYANLPFLVRQNLIPNMDLIVTITTMFIVYEIFIMVSECGY